MIVLTETPKNAGYYPLSSLSTVSFSRLHLHQEHTNRTGHNYIEPKHTNTPTFSTVEIQQRNIYYCTLREDSF